MIVSGYLSDIFCWAVGGTCFFAQKRVVYHIRIHDTTRKPSCLSQNTIQNMKNIQLFLDVFVLVLLVHIHLYRLGENFVMSRCHTRESIVGARKKAVFFNFFIYFCSFRLFRWFRFGRFVSLFRVLVHALFLVVEYNIYEECILALSAWYNWFLSSDSCVRYHTLVLTDNSSYISGNISSPFFSAKNAFVTAHLIPSSVQKCCVLLSNYFVFVKL